VRLFGGFELTSRARGDKVVVPGKRERVLLAYLALSPECRTSRRKLCSLLWGDANSKTTLDNLRVCVWSLRKALGDEKHRVVASDNEDIMLDAAAFDVDAWAYRQLSAQSAPAELQAAANLYGGEFLDGLDIDSDDFETWRRTEATRYRDQATDVFARLLAQFANAGETERAIEAGTKLLRLEPLHEPAVRQLIRLYDQTDRRGAAIQLYRSFADNLRKELNAQPRAETRATFAEISRGGEERSVSNTISLAVLPFANMSGDPGQEYFSDGVTEEINAALAKVPDLHVVARTSAFQFKGQNQDVRVVGQALGASHLIEGSVRKLGDRVRIAAQLVRADNGLQLWSESYDRQLTNIFAIQEDIAQSIAASLRVPLGFKQGETLVSNRTSDVESYQQYLRGRALVRARAVADAINVLEAVVARDPTYAPAWALLAQAYHLAPYWGSVLRTGSLEEARLVVRSAINKGEAAAQRAIELDSRNASGYSILALFQAQAGKWAAAVDFSRQALALDPNEPDVLHNFSQILAYLGRSNEALALRERLRSLEPFVPIYNIVTAEIMQAIGQSQASIFILEPIPSSAAGGYFRNLVLARAYASAGRHAQAADVLLAITGDHVDRRSVEDAARLLRAAPKVAEPEQLPTLQGELNFVYAHVGAMDRILEFSERNVELQSLTGTQIRGLWLPEYAPLRKTERFKRLVRNAGLVDYWKARGWPDVSHSVIADDFACD
jgi:TolB-like protein